MGPEASTEFPRSSVAMQPHSDKPQNPESTTKLISIIDHTHFFSFLTGVLQLIAEEDVIEASGSKSLLTGPQYVLPSEQPNPFVSRSKEFIFVEKRGQQGQ